MTRASRNHRNGLKGGEKKNRKISYHSSSLAHERVRERHLNVFIGGVRKVWRSVAIGETRPLEAGRRPYTPGETFPPRPRLPLLGVMVYVSVFVLIVLADYKDQ